MIALITYILVAITTVDCMCLGGWKRSPQRSVCFGYFSDRYFAERQVWRNALLRCQEQGGTLAKTISLTEHNTMRSLCPNNNCRSAWIGLNDISIEGRFQWADRSPLDWTHWRYNEPKNKHGDEDCVVHVEYPYLPGQWNDVRCNQLLPYFCEMPTFCPPGWRKSPHRDVCYNYFSDKQTWHNALAKCRQQGGTLAKITTKLELNTMRSNCPNMQCGSERGGVWIGLNDIAKEGQWRWTDNSRMGFMHWMKNEPNSHGGNEDCVELWINDRWNDKRCNIRSPYICEKPL